MQTQSTIEGWPALLTLEGACRYLSLEKAQFLALTKKWTVRPVEVDSEAVLWRLGDLDLLVKRLPAALPLSNRMDPSRPVHLDQATIDQIAQAVAMRLEAKRGMQSAIRPQLVSIVEAASQLGLGRSRIYQMINDGSLRVRRLGRRTLVTQESIQALIDA